MFILSSLSAQDTLRVMHYNLLYYGNSSFCNESNNNTDMKDAFLRTLIEYVEPDIFTVNEMSYLDTYQTRVLNDVFGQMGYAHFERAEAPNLAGAAIVNQLYYNSDKLVLKSQEVAQSHIRDINVYNLYSKTEGLVDGDTIFIHCIVAHLKSSTGNDNEAERLLMVGNTLDYLEENGTFGNYLFMGDFNFYESSESGFQRMIANNDPVFKFYDPVNAIGDWHENWEFGDVHTQSTRTENNCGAHGGMDDRFDFIMINKVINDKADKVYYLDDSYWALGQDGERLNGSIADPPNTSLPAYMIDALLGMSDHLPVIMDLVIDNPLGVDDVYFTSAMKVSFSNPVKNNLKLWIETDAPGMAEVMIVSLSGTMVHKEHMMLDRSNTFSISLDSIPSGMYFLRIQQQSATYTGKVVVIK
jgi:hypothetical protein